MELCRSPLSPCINGQCWQKGVVPVSCECACVYSTCSTICWRSYVTLLSNVLHIDLNRNVLCPKSPQMSLGKLQEASQNNLRYPSRPRNLPNPPHGTLWEETHSETCIVLSNMLSLVSGKMYIGSHLHDSSGHSNIKQPYLVWIY